MDHLRALHASLISKWNPVNLKPDCLRHWFFFSSLVGGCLVYLLIVRWTHIERGIIAMGGHLLTWAHGWHKTCIYMLPVFRLTMLCWAFFIQALWHTQRGFSDNAFLNGCSCQKYLIFLTKDAPGHLILVWEEKKLYMRKGNLQLINLTESKPCCLNHTWYVELYFCLETLHQTTQNN